LENNDVANASRRLLGALNFLLFLPPEEAGESESEATQGSGPATGGRINHVIPGEDLVADDGGGGVGGDWRRGLFH